MEAELIITSSKSGKSGTCNREERCDLGGSGCFDFKVSKKVTPFFTSCIGSSTPPLASSESHRIALLTLPFIINEANTFEKCLSSKLSWYVCFFLPHLTASANNLSNLFSFQSSMRRPISVRMSFDALIIGSLCNKTRLITRTLSEVESAVVERSFSSCVRRSTYFLPMLPLGKVYSLFGNRTLFTHLSVQIEWSRQVDLSSDAPNASIIMSSSWLSRFGSVSGSTFSICRFCMAWFIPVRPLLVGVTLTRSLLSCDINKSSTSNPLVLETLSCESELYPK